MKSILIVGCASTAGAYIGEELSNRDYQLYGTYHNHIPLNPANYVEMFNVNLLEKEQLHLLDAIMQKVDSILFTVGNTNFAHSKE